ncbi:MAG: AAA family ATPase [Cyanobacteria bacterium P01_G01_bin.54]
MTASSEPLFICHCLIGPPGSGKSTLAQQWVARCPEYRWVSTDQIRQALFGDASVQGHWPAVETEVLRQIRGAIANHQPVIYDATNARRAWRLDLMQKLADGHTQWMAWWLKIPLSVCKKRDQGRERQVGTAVIEHFHQALRDMPPLPAEGFAVVNAVPLGDHQVDWDAIAHKIQTLPQSLLQRQRRQGQCQLHPYSSLLAFERLLYLLEILLRYPGAGRLQQSAQLPQALRQSPRFETAVDEINALIAHHYGGLYAQPGAITQDLAWLQANHIVNAPYTPTPIDLPEVDEPPKFSLHRYSDQAPFKRLLGTFRFIVHHPFLYVPGQGSLNTLVVTLETQGVIPPGYSDSVRRDMGEIFKPYGLMTKTSQTQGYFIGTAILSKAELLRVYNSLAGQVHHLDDPVLLTTYETFRERVKFLQQGQASPMPVRTVLQQSIVDIQQFPTHTGSLAAPGNAENLEDAILYGKVLTLKRRRGTARFAGEAEDAFQVLPLQIVFHNIAWYLGYQRLSDGLLRFERLDRLELLPSGLFTRPKAAQAKAWDDMMRLYGASYGIYLGNSATDQQAFLRGTARARAQIEETCELWFTDAIFRFISEGTQRFPGRQQMSPRLPGAAMTATEKKTLFCLPKTGDATFPNRFKVNLPNWVITHDVDFKRWILGFGGQVKVISPQTLVEYIQSRGREIWQVYE